MTQPISPAVAAALRLLAQAQQKAAVKTAARTEASAHKASLTPKRKPVEPAPVRKLAMYSDRWVYEALVLPISRVTCKGCGHTTEVNGGKLLLARKDKRTGAIWESTEGATGALPPLPRRRRVHETTSEACGKCFDGLKNLAHIACLVPVPEHPVPIYDTPSAYDAARRIAALRPAGKPTPMPITIDTEFSLEAL